MAAIYGAAERQAKKIGSMGSVSSLIAAIGGGRTSEAGKGSKPKKKKRGTRTFKGGSKEMQEMLQGRYRGKVKKTQKPTARSGPM